MSTNKLINDFYQKVEELNIYNIENIKKALLFSKRKHEGQKRLSGEDYITHLINVALILLNFKLDEDTIIAALLHDVLEDTDTKEEEITKNFSENILKLIQGVTKISTIKSSYKYLKEEYNLRNFILAFIDDIRVLFIKLADRLHNLQTLQYQPPLKRLQIAKNTLEIYAPLAERIGVEWIKNELEDRSLYYLDPKMYLYIKSLVVQKKEEREKELVEIISNITYILKSHNIKDFEIKGRAKHFYSIYKKMKEHNKTFDEIFDLIGIRILTKNVNDCYTILGIIHNKYKPITGRFKDYIALPKNNLYQSIHTTVIDNNKRKLEIQIRTYEMDQIAEYGIAAHWIYKENIKNIEQIQEQINIVNKIRKWDLNDFNQNEIISNIKSDLLKEDIFIFTPKGDIVQLPKGATALDFAFAIHTEVGLKAIGAKINGKLAPLRKELRNTDVVEIITSEKKLPSTDWLTFVKTRKAKTKLKNYFNKLKNLNKDSSIIINQKTLQIINEQFYLNEKNEQIKDDSKTNKTLDNKVNIEENYELIKKEQLIQNRDAYKIFINKEKNIDYEFAKCCNPLPGDNIKGIVSIRRKKIIIHKSNCENIRNIKNKNKIFDVQWSEEFKFYFSKYNIIGKGNSTYVLSEILTAIDKSNLILEHLNFHTKPFDKVICYVIIKSKTQENIKYFESMIEKSNYILNYRKVN
jgi:GTP pyrophosphokinase